MLRVAFLRFVAAGIFQTQLIDEDDVIAKRYHFDFSLAHSLMVVNCSRTSFIFFARFNNLRVEIEKVNQNGIC